MDQVDTEPLLFGGSSHPELVQAIMRHTKVRIGSMRTERFPDGEISLEVLENVRGLPVFILQSLAHKPNEFLFELMIAADAFKRASARKVIAVIPYLAYCRQDRKDKPGAPISARLVADLLKEAGVEHIVGVDFHSEQVQGFFDIPVEELHGRTLLIEAVKQDRFENGIVVAPDMGNVKNARAFAKGLGVDFAVVDKRRINAFDVEASQVVGDVKGKNVLLADDMCSTGATLVSAAKACQEKGAKQIFAAVTHCLLTKDGADLLEKSPIDRLYVTDSVKIDNDARRLKALRVVSIAPLLGDLLLTLSTEF